MLGDRMPARNAAPRTRRNCSQPFPSERTHRPRRGALLVRRGPVRWGEMVTASSLFRGPINRQNREVTLSAARADSGNGVRRDRGKNHESVDDSIRGALSRQPDEQTSTHGVHKGSPLRHRLIPPVQDGRIISPVGCEYPHMPTSRMALMAVRPTRQAGGGVVRVRRGYL
jgi:hypothetical protein